MPGVVETDAGGDRTEVLYETRVDMLEMTGGLSRAVEVDMVTFHDVYV